MRGPVEQFECVASDDESVVGDPFVRSVADIGGDTTVGSYDQLAEINREFRIMGVDELALAMEGNV